MLAWGTIKSIPDWIPFRVYNFTSLSQKYPMLNLLPPEEFMRVSGSAKDFDILYMQYIFNTDIAFNSLMSIVYDLYTGKDVYIAISDVSDPYIENLNESVIKLIQQRYGYNSYRVNQVEDFDFVNPDFGSFSLNGIYNLDQDKERYSVSLEVNRIISTGDGGPHG